MLDESGYSDLSKPICHLRTSQDCQKEMSPQDSRGWERIPLAFPVVNNEMGIEAIWLCPNCIFIFEAVKDLMAINNNNTFERGEIRHALNRLLEYADKGTLEAAG